MEIQTQPGSDPTARGNDGATDLDNLQYVTFNVNEELFGVPMNSVREIIRMPTVVRVPLSPASLEGLANLRGRVLPVVDLRRSFHISELEHGDSTRVLVTDFGTLVGFVVDRVASVISVERDRIESADTIKATVDTRLINGVIKSNGGAHDQMTVLLDLAQVLARDFAALAEAQKLGSEQGVGPSHEPTQEVDSNASEIQLVSFQVAGQEYAFPISCVQEIVQVPSGFCHVPNAGSHVLGVMTLRDRLLPIVSLREMFHLPKAALEEQNRIVVLKLDEEGDGAAVGVVMDTVKEVLRLPASSVGPLPQLLARDQHIQEVESICRLDGGKRLVSVLSVERMFRHAAFSEATRLQRQGERGDQNVEQRTVTAADDEEQMVVFRLGAEEYGVAIEDVQEILRVAEHFTHVPNSADFIEGLVSLRGTVLPVVDLRRRFGMPAKERDERQRVMVFSVKDVKTGVIVDAVSEVLKLSRATFERAPELSTEQAGVIKRVANLEKQKRMILVLETGELFNSGELGALAQVS